MASLKALRRRHIPRLFARFSLFLLLESLERVLVGVKLLPEHLFVFFGSDGLDLFLLVVVEIIFFVLETPIFSEDPEPTNVAASDLFTPILLIVVIVSLVNAHRTVGHG